MHVCTYDSWDTCDTSEVSNNSSKRIYLSVFSSRSLRAQRTGRRLDPPPHPPSPLSFIVIDQEIYVLFLVPPDRRSQTNTSRDKPSLARVATPQTDKRTGHVSYHTHPVRVFVLKLRPHQTFCSQVCQVPGATAVRKRILSVNSNKLI